MRLLAFAILLAITAAARADLIPNNYSVYINGTNTQFLNGTGSMGSATTFVSAGSSVGDVQFTATLKSNTVQFSFSNTLFGKPGLGLSPVLRDVLFVANGVADNIIGITYDIHASTAFGLGVVPSTSVIPGPAGPTTDIDFDFSKAALFRGATLTYDLSFTPQVSAPEIDPSLASSGLLLIAGGIAVLRGRRLRGPARETCLERP